MIYLVSNNQLLFKDPRYTIISPQAALKLLWEIPVSEKYGYRLVGADTETQGLDVFTKKILTIQLGTYDFQIVWDCIASPIQLLKEFLEDSKTLTIWWNYMFDGKFLFHCGIYPENIYDGFVAEKLLYLGAALGSHTYSLKAAGVTYCGIELDKSVRGQIITKGTTPDVVVYAANDVKYEIPIFEAQYRQLEEKELLKACKFECEFLKPLIYVEYCGVKLDVPRWKRKMEKDQAELNLHEGKLNQWVVDFYNSHNGKGLKTVDIDFIWESNKGKKTKKFEVPLPYKALGPIRPEAEGFNTYKKQLIRVEFPFVFKDLQGDLWSGFNCDVQCNINWASPKQVIPFLELLGFNLETFDKKTKQKKKSVDTDTIKANLMVSPIAGIFLKYKKAAKVVAAFGQNFIDAINPVTGRIHADFHSIGTDTARVSCGGGETGVNVQQLPHDEETRACFISERGNDWISADYQSQESRIIASVANDQAMIDLFINGCGDVHSLVAKMSYSDVIGDCPVEEIKHKYHEYRQDAKGIEFAINYGGDANTIANNKGIPLKEAEKIYGNFMKGFPGIKKYQDYCRKEVMRKGYILLNPVLGHKAFVNNWQFLEDCQEQMKDPEFWAYYKAMKNEDSNCEVVQEVRQFMKQKSDYEKKSINYRIQNRGAMCSKLAGIKLYNWIKKNHLLNVVKICVPVHDKQICCV